MYVVHTSILPNMLHTLNNCMCEHYIMIQSHSIQTGLSVFNNSFTVIINKNVSNWRAKHTNSTQISTL